MDFSVALAIALSAMSAVSASDEDDICTYADQCCFKKKQQCEGIKCNTYCTCSQQPDKRLSGKCSNECQNPSSKSCSFECLDGYFGNRCDRECKNCKDGKCNKTNGHCLEGCTRGYYRPMCKIQCEMQCRLDICDGDTGNCTLGCKDGYYGQKCKEKCPKDCCVCHPESGICLIDHCNAEGGTHTCVVRSVIIAIFGVTLFIITGILIFRFYKRKAEQIEKNIQTTRPPIDVPRSSDSQANVGHYEEIRENFYLNNQVSRSLGTLDEQSVRSTVKPPDKPKLSLPRRKVRNTLAKRRTKSLSSSTSSLDVMPSCWVGKGQEIFELFSPIPEGQNDDRRVSEQIEDYKKSAADQAKDVATFDTEEGFPGAPETKPDDKPLNDRLSVKSGKSEARKGYISAIFDNSDADPLLASVGTHNVIPE